MRDKLEKLIAAYEELEKRMVDPAVVGDPKEYARIAKEHASQADLVAKAREYLTALEDIDVAKEMMHEESDPDERAMLQEDIAANEQKIVDAAKSAVGTRYNVLGITPETGFTATSYIVWCLNTSGAGLYKYTDMEHLYTRAGDIAYYPHDVGDVVFFVRNGVEHAGIYIGDNKALIAGEEVREITIGEGEWEEFQVVYGKYTPYM